jgi:hypothetical protein
MIRTIRATVRGGRLETETPIDLPEGTELDLSIDSVYDPDVLDPSEVERILKIMDECEPVEWTEEERAEWERDLKAMKEAEIAGMKKLDKIFADFEP